MTPLFEAAPAVFGIGGGGLSVGIVAWFFFRRMVERTDRRQDRLEGDVARLRDSEVKELKEDFKQFTARCVGRVVDSKLETVISQNNEILRDIKKLDRETARQGQALDEQDDHLKRLHTRFTKHMEKHHGE